MERIITDIYSPIIDNELQPPVPFIIKGPMVKIVCPFCGNDVGMFPRPDSNIDLYLKGYGLLVAHAPACIAPKAQVTLVINHRPPIPFDWKGMWGINVAFHP